MIVTCPACENSYFVEDSTLGQGRAELTCVSCSHVWFEEVEGGRVGDETLARGAHERYLEAVRLRGRRRSRFVATTVWALVMTLIAGGLGAAVFYRDEVARAWPQSASAFALIGLEVNRFGVDFENIQRSRELRGTVPVLSVSADVRNITDKPREAPRVRVGLLDDFGREVAHIFVAIEPSLIPAGEAGHFSAVLENPPAESYSLDLRFVDPAEISQHADASADEDDPNP
ncbi:MAG: zinc-ribbon domain-containing protein [Hyphomonadaceae bacterium]|nr:zinc-ribbon domain-containing protein [Hyphomonadaceae bacterium]